MLPKSRLVPVFVLALGVAMLVAGLLLPRLATDPDRVPLDLSTTTLTLTDRDGYYANPVDDEVPAPGQTTPITRQIHVELIPPATEDTVTARIGYSTLHGGVDDLDNLVRAEVWSGTFDRVTGFAEGKGSVATQYASPPTELDLPGSWLKFPAHVEKQSYNFFDPQLRAAFEAEFTGEDTIDGLPVYTFEQTIAPQNVAKRYADPLGTLQVDRGGQQERAFLFHGAKRQFWVDPESGLIVKLVEDVNEYYGLNDGQEVRPYLRFRGEMADADIQSKVDQAKDIGEHADRGVWSSALIILGGIVSVIAAIVALRPRRRHSDHDD